MLIAKQRCSDISPRSKASPVAYSAASPGYFPAYHSFSNLLWRIPLHCTWQIFEFICHIFRKLYF